MILVANLLFFEREKPCTVLKYLLKSNKGIKDFPTAKVMSEIERKKSGKKNILQPQSQASKEKRRSK